MKQSTTNNSHVHYVKAPPIEPTKSPLPRTHEILGHTLKSLLNPVLRVILFIFTFPIGSILALVIPTSKCINCNRVYWLGAKPNKRCKTNPY